MIGKYAKSKYVLLYQMGKVASTTISNSLKEIGYEVWSPHTMKADINIVIFDKYRNPKCLNTVEKIELYNRQVKKMAKLHVIKKRKSLKIITVVREPVSRNVSLYFHNLHIPLMELAKRYDMRSESNSNISSLVKEFKTSFNHCNSVEWLDQEIKRYIGIDVYNYPFEKEGAYGVIKEGNIEILIIKYERLRECGEVAIRNFINDNSFAFISTNISSKKWYESVFSRFKEEIVYDSAFIELLYNSKYVRHFYSDREICEFYKNIKIYV